MFQALLERKLRPADSALVPRKQFRGDIEGLRAVAVLLVLLFHAGIDVPGGYIGVDVFFVISGFLITSLLLKEMRETGHISLVGFYGRRAKRLLPATAAMLTTTVLLTYLFIPKLRWSDIAYDTIGSAVYVENWRLAQLAVDYNAQDQPPSPLQHFWSLAVEEQFYLIWPLLMLLVTLWSRPRVMRDRHTVLAGRSRSGQRGLALPLMVGFALIAVPSLLWSVRMTATNPDAAYFVTTTRLWELAVGAAIAISAHWLVRMPRLIAVPLGWSGVATVVVAAFVITTATPFPGTAALAPTLGTAAVIASGVAAGRFGPVVLLGLRPMRWVGMLSYSLYLWHWPLLIVAAAQFGPLTVSQGAAVVAASFVPAYLSFKLVEDPARRSERLNDNPLAALNLGFLCTVAGVFAGVALLFATWPPPPPFSPIAVSTEPRQNGEAPIGAQVLAQNPRGDTLGAPVDQVPSIVPAPEQAELDIPGESCTAGKTTADVSTCVYGDPNASVDVALTGDSHAAQWIGALDAIGKERGWRITTYLKANCPLADVEFSLEFDSAYVACTAWRGKVETALTGPDTPDLMITSGVDRTVIQDGQVLIPSASLPLQADGYQSLWQRLMDNGTAIAAIRDTPRPATLIPECVSEHLDELTACAVPRAEAGQVGQALALASSDVPGVTYIDLNDAICPTKMCAPVIGGVLVYRDSNHLTGTYAGTLAARLNAALPDLG